MLHPFVERVQKINPRIKLSIVLLATFLTGLLLGYVLHAQNKILNREIRTKQNSFTFINPLLECENATFENIGNIRNLQNKVEDRINEGVTHDEAQLVSVYYRDFNNGPWFGINETEEFAPASLIKVPLLLALYKSAETNPDLLNKKITITEDIHYDEINFIPQNKLGKGQTYTIKELMEHMIVDSDNNAYDLLLSNSDINIVNQVYMDLGIDIQKENHDNPNGNFISVREYAGFFRVLFNASYISNQSSETALEMLSRSTFTQGLVAGLPAGTKVSHKFGERYYTFSGIRQLHDCGIVYHPKRPYLLCVMTKGNEFDSLAKMIEDISRIVYEENNP